MEYEIWIFETIEHHLKVFVLSAYFKENIQINDNLRLIEKDAIINGELVQKIILINKIEYFSDENLFVIVNYCFRKKNNVEFEIIERDRLIKNFEWQNYFFIKWRKVSIHEKVETIDELWFSPSNHSLCQLDDTM